MKWAWEYYDTQTCRAAECHELAGYCRTASRCHSSWWNPPATHANTHVHMTRQLRRQTWNWIIGSSFTFGSPGHHFDPVWDPSFSGFRKKCPKCRTYIWHLKCGYKCSYFHSRPISFFFCTSSLPQPFLFLFQDSLYGFLRLFTVTSELSSFFTF